MSPLAPAAPVSPLSPLAPAAPVSPLSPLGPAGPVSPFSPLGPVAPEAPVEPPPTTLRVYSLVPFEVIFRPSPAISFRVLLLFDLGSYLYVPTAGELPLPSWPWNTNGFRFSMRFATANNWEPLIASVEVEEIRPAATFWIWRSLPAEPTDNTAPLFKPLVAPAKPP